MGADFDIPTLTLNFCADGWNADVLQQCELSAEVAIHNILGLDKKSKSPSDLLLRGFFNWKLIPTLMDTRTTAQQHNQDMDC